MAKRLEIMVRSRVRRSFSKWETEWTETVDSWKKAWAVVDGCGADRRTCRKINTNHDRATAVVEHWCLDIDGRREHQEYKEWLKRMSGKRLIQSGRLIVY